MGSTGSLGRHAASRLITHYTFLGIALPALLLAIGCDRLAEPDLASRDLKESSAPAATVESGDAVSPGGSSGLDDAATVPKLSNETTEPKPELEPPPAKLGIGDASPGLHVAKYVKGEPVDPSLKDDKVHVVEFWATWCGPCRVGMPHISELQSEYGDEVAFVGITRETEAKVASFLQAKSPDGRPWDEVIQYRLAIDDRDWTNTAYMNAAGQNGIPCAFVVGRDGVVEWIGHPARIDEPLKQIVNGSWDREAAIAEYKQQERLKEVTQQIAQYSRSGEWDSALELLAQLESETGKSKGLIDYRIRLLQGAGRAEEASAARAELVELIWDDAQALNDFAWRTATSGASADLELALKAATRGSEIRDNQDAMILDTVARCHYELGDLDEAIKWQSMAVEHNHGLAEIDATLQRYRGEKAAAENEQAKKVEENENENASDGESEEASADQAADASTDSSDNESPE